MRTSLQWFASVAGFFSPRLNNNGRPLPSARLVSKVLNDISNIPDFSDRAESPINTLHMMQVGQFLDHDLTHAPAQGGVNGGGLCACATKKS